MTQRLGPVITPKINNDTGQHALFMRLSSHSGLQAAWGLRAGVPC
ncbi:MAG: hypothetical protein Q7U12_14535 [Undibacterium sp.]|nr:hypothetical protein [Undibacterium sp.]